LRPERLVLPALAALGIAAQATAEDLFLLRSWRNEAVLIDRDSIARQGASARAWVVERRDRPGAEGSETRSFYVFDCSAGTLGKAQRHGAAGGSAPESALAPPRSVLEETLLAYACGR
jgi:hypothetical protein